MKDSDETTLITAAAGRISKGYTQEKVLPRGSYLIIFPDSPTAEEYARGARLIPSMVDEGIKVWRVPNE